MNVNEAPIVETLPNIAERVVRFVEYARLECLIIELAPVGRLVQYSPAVEKA